MVVGLGRAPARSSRARSLRSGVIEKHIARCCTARNIKFVVACASGLTRGASMRNVCTLLFYLVFVDQVAAISLTQVYDDRFDGRVVSLTLEANNVRGEKIYRKRQSGIVLRKSKGREEMFIIPGLSYICGHGNSPQVQWVFDTRKPISYSAWNVSTDNQAVFVPAKVLKTIVDWMERSKKVSIRITDHCGNFAEIDFELDDHLPFASAYSEYKQALQEKIN
jgi:hypothetical protein